MTAAESYKLHPQVPFLYEMVISFFEATRQTLDPVLHAIDGYRELEIDPDGATPDHVVRMLAKLPSSDAVHHVGACLSAATNLGLAYVHAFRLLSFLTQDKDALPPNAAKPHSPSCTTPFPPPHGTRCATYMPKWALTTSRWK